MPNKKTAAPEPSPEEQALEQRVKTIMEPARPAPIPVASAAAVETPPPIDIFSDPKTAPTVSAKLLAKIGTEASSPSVEAKETKAPDQNPPAVPAESKEPTPAADNPPPDATNEQRSTPIDSDAIDKAVDDIVVNEGDVVLAAEDAASQQVQATSKPGADRPHWFKHLLANKWIWFGLLVALIMALAIPSSRYRLLGLVLKESLSVTVTDSKTNVPVSNASVSYGAKTAKTDASGKAKLSVPPGPATLRITKQYFKTYSALETVSLRSGARVAVSLVATGRQVPITVRNRITGQPLADAEISVLDTTAKTNRQGLATIVLPTTSVSDSATVSLSSYNTAHASIQVTSTVVSANTVNLTPAGHIYFLSNLSGTIDVVKTNLDGSGRQSLLAGTGKEDPNSTSLLASRDWRYLVLKAQRSGTSPALYLIDTSNDKVTQFDSGNTDFTLVGWYGHYFVYDTIHNTVSAWQTGRETLKSYNADTGQPMLLDQNQAEGSSTAYAYQGFYNFYILDNLIAYNTQWYTYGAGGSSYDLSGKTDTIRAIQPTGQGKKDYQTISASGVGSIQAALFEPQGVYYEVYNYNTSTTSYYKFEGQTISTLNSLNQTTFSQAYPTYLVSPSGNQTFWTELRDGQNALFVGDQNGNNRQQIANLSGYAPYGWYTDSYLLVSQNSSELSIIPATGLHGSQRPLKITDYYKPTQTYTGYGYGYGGL